MYVSLDCIVFIFCFCYCIFFVFVNLLLLLYFVFVFVFVCFFIARLGEVHALTRAVAVVVAVVFAHAGVQVRPHHRLCQRGGVCGVAAAFRERAVPGIVSRICVMDTYDDPATRPPFTRNQTFLQYMYSHNYWTAPCIYQCLLHGTLIMCSPTC